jgi:hypothetical protein
LTNSPLICDIFVVCVSRVVANVSIVVGDWQRSAESSVRQTLDVEKIVQNSGYNSRTMENDVSVIKVASDIVFNENVGPVCAPDPDNLYTYYKSQVSGWGTLVSGFYHRNHLCGNAQQVESNSHESSLRF